jgi:hypothetical protein
MLTTPLLRTLFYFILFYFILFYFVAAAVGHVRLSLPLSLSLSRLRGRVRGTMAVELHPMHAGAQAGDTAYLAEVCPLVALTA